MSNLGFETLIAARRAASPLDGDRVLELRNGRYAVLVTLQGTPGSTPVQFLVLPNRLRVPLEYARKMGWLLTS